ncbi:MAG: JAB domain-containing protein [Dolichospermum sp.]
MVNFSQSNDIVRDEEFLCVDIQIPKIMISVTITKSVPFNKMYSITCALDAYHILQSAYDNIDFQERFVVICLNRANKVIGLFTASVGGVAGTVADPKVIFTASLNCGASAIIISHNHPSGNATPSQADKDLTKKMVEAGKMLDLPVLDHLIITRERFLSFAEEGLLN